MPDELDLFVTALTGVLGEMAGIHQAPEHPPEGIGDTPMAVVHIVRWDATRLPIVLYTVYAEVILARSTLPEDEAQSRPYIIRGLTALAANIRMNETCEHCLIKEGFGPGPIRWQGKEHFGVRYVLEVKIRHSGIVLSV